MKLPLSKLTLIRGKIRHHIALKNFAFYASHSKTFIIKKWQSKGSMLLISEHSDYLLNLLESFLRRLHALTAGQWVDFCLIRRYLLSKAHFVLCWLHANILSRLQKSLIIRGWLITHRHSSSSCSPDQFLVLFLKHYSDVDLKNIH